MTTVFNLSQHDTPGFLGQRVPTYGQPLVVPTDTTADGAGNVELNSRALMLRVAVVGTVGLYVKTGPSGASALTVGTGWYCFPGQELSVPVGITDGVRHTHLFWINADA